MQTSHRLAVFLAGLLSLLAATTGAQPATGSIAGRVQNIATSQYLVSARITVKGTPFTALTDNFGAYRIDGVPAGGAVVEAFYSGLDPQQASVTVASGAIARQDFDLTNRALYGDRTGVVKLEAFVMTSSKLTEGEALATNEQRFAANIKNVVATDAYGDVIEGNVAEFM